MIIDGPLLLPQVVNVVWIAELSSLENRVPADVLKLDIKKVDTILARTDRVRAPLVEPDCPDFTIEGIVGCRVKHAPIAYVMGDDGLFGSIKRSFDSTNHTSDLECGWAAKDCCLPRGCKTDHAIFCDVVELVRNGAQRYDSVNPAEVVHVEDDYQLFSVGRIHDRRWHASHN